MYNNIIIQRQDGRAVQGVRLRFTLAATCISSWSSTEGVGSNPTLVIFYFYFFSLTSVVNAWSLIVTIFYSPTKQNPRISWHWPMVINPVNSHLLLPVLSQIWEPSKRRKNQHNCSEKKKEKKKEKAYFVPWKANKLRTERIVWCLSASTKKQWAL